MEEKWTLEIQVYYILLDTFLSFSAAETLICENCYKELSKAGIDYFANVLSHTRLRKIIIFMYYFFIFFLPSYLPLLQKTAITYFLSLSIAIFYRAIC